MHDPPDQGARTRTWSAMRTRTTRGATVVDRRAGRARRRSAGSPAYQPLERETAGPRQHDGCSPSTITSNRPTESDAPGDPASRAATQPISASAAQATQKSRASMCRLRHQCPACGPRSSPDKASCSSICAISRVEPRLVLRLGARDQHVLGVGGAQQPPAVGRVDPRAVGAVDRRRRSPASRSSTSSTTGNLRLSSTWKRISGVLTIGRHRRAQARSASRPAGSPRGSAAPPRRARRRSRNNRARRRCGRSSRRRAARRFPSSST